MQITARSTSRSKGKHQIQFFVVMMKELNPVPCGHEPSAKHHVSGLGVEQRTIKSPCWSGVYPHCHFLVFTATYKGLLLIFIVQLSSRKWLLYNAKCHMTHSRCCPVLVICPASTSVIQRSIGRVQQHSFSTLVWLGKTSFMTL